MTNRKKFEDREYRASYAESFLDTSIATQIRVLREQRELTQAELAELAGMKQSRISALEDANYSRWSIATLKRLARAFDVPLNVGFGTFGGLLADIDGFNRRSLERPAFAADPALLGDGATMATATNDDNPAVATTARVLSFTPGPPERTTRRWIAKSASTDDGPILRQNVAS